MEPIKHNQHTHIEEFNPDVKMLHDSYQDFFCQMKEFNAGVEYQNFNDFVINEASEYAASGDGVTYIVWNVFSDTDGRELRRDMVAFYTLGVTAIPYEDRIRLDEEEACATGQTYDSEASHDWKSQASFHGLTHPCWAEPIKRRFPVAIFRYLPVRASTGSFSL